jgi:hypothetical protein
MLEDNLNKSLFGQPLVKNTVLNALKGHFNLNGPKKALVLSFHGSTGVGSLNFLFFFLLLNESICNVRSIKAKTTLFNS